MRLHDGSLIAHVDQDLGDRLLAAGVHSFRSGSRRYLRLPEGITIPRTERGWGVIEYLRRWLGDRAAASYMAHEDRQSERLRCEPPTDGKGR